MFSTIIARPFGASAELQQKLWVTSCNLCAYPISADLLDPLTLVQYVCLNISA
jgi:hypothetical protein